MSGDTAVQFGLLFIVVALARSILANPLLASLNNDEQILEEAVLAARQTISELRCSSPCKECNTTKTTFAGVQEARDNLDLNKQYCVDSDGSDEAKSNNNWALVENCGADNAAIWLQTYIRGKWCLSGRAIQQAVDRIIRACKPADSNNLYGYVKIDGKEQWVEVGRSANCNPGRVATAPEPESEECDEKDLATSTRPITPCEDGSYCCGNGTLADACCKQKKGFFVVNRTASASPTKAKTSSFSTSRISSSPISSSPIFSSPISSSPIPSSPISSSTIFSPPLSPLSPPSGAPTINAQDRLNWSVSLASSTPKSSNNAGAIAGGTIGGVAALVVLAIGITLILKHRKSRNQPPGYSTSQTTRSEGQNKLNGELDHEFYKPPEVHTTNELEARPGPLPELSG